MALAYLAAFWSLGSQVTGLIGERGILPAGEYLAVIRAARPEGYLGVLPTLGWLGASDAALLGFCVSGATLALAAGAGALSAPALIVCYVLYLSLVHLGQVFLHFQWDILLTEAGFLAIFVAPWSLRAAMAARDRRAATSHGVDAAAAALQADALVRRHQAHLGRPELVGSLGALVPLLVAAASHLARLVRAPAPALGPSVVVRGDVLHRDRPALRRVRAPRRPDRGVLGVSSGFSF